MKKSILVIAISILAVLTIVFGVLYFTNDAAKTKTIDNLKAEIGVKADAIETLTADAAEKAGVIETLEAEAAKKDGTIETLTADVAEKAGTIETLEAEAAKKDGTIETLTTDVAEKAGTIETLNAEAAERDKQIEELSRQASERAVEIKSLTTDAEKKIKEIETLQAEAKEKDQAIADWKGKAAEKDTRITSLEAEVAEKDKEIESLKTELEDKKQPKDSEPPTEDPTLKTEEQKNTADNSKYFLALPLEDGTAEIVYYNGTEEKTTVPDTLDGMKVTVIARDAFNGCETLTEIILPEGIRRIETYAFYNCKNLTSITLPDSIESIGTNPFDGCVNLVDFIVSPDHPWLVNRDGVLYGDKGRRLICCPASWPAEEYMIPEGTTAIASEAFYGCESLIAVTIPDSVAEVGENPFAACTRLKSIAVSAEHPVLTIAGDALFLKAEKKIVSYPLGLTEEE